VFTADWAVQPRAPIAPTELELFPDEADEPIWTAAKRQQVCDVLNVLPTLADRAQALPVYRALIDDALRVLSGLPGCERAFTQLTVQPLSPDDPATADRRGPDDGPDYAPRPQLRAYLDQLDGRALNRYLYRAVAVDGAHNRSVPGPVGTPVRLPNVTPPRPPTVTAVTAGARSLTVAWASNREPDLAEYRVYRADAATGAVDVRLMTLVATVAAEPDPTARPATVTWTDAPLPGLVDRWYRLVAVDRPDPDPRGGGGNASAPSPAVRARALQPPPSPPLLASPIWDPAHTSVELSWELDDPALLPRVERRRGEGDPWTVVLDGLAPGTTAATDTPTDPAGGYEYRIRVRDHIRQQAVSELVPTP
jgi:hypothetical protein